MATLAPDDEPVAATATAPKRKALPFKRTVSRKGSSSADPKKPDDDNDLDLFRHSHEVFPEILREAEEEKEQQQYDRKRQRLSSNSTDETLRARKRSATLDTSDDDLIMDVKGKGKEIIRPPRGPSTPGHTTTTRATPRTPRSTRSNPRSPASRRSTSRNPAGSPAGPITILDSDSDDGVKHTPSLPQQTNRNPPRGDPNIPSSSASSPIEILPDPSEEEDPSESTQPSATDDFSEWVAKARALQALQSQQAIVRIILTSHLPACARPVFIQRRLNQGVQLLLDAWTDNMRSGGKRGEEEPVTIPDDVAAGLFLTWKRHKIYGHSTLASLGVQVDAQGNLKNNRGEGYRSGGIHLEVWTEEAYTQYLQSRGKERALMMGAGGGDYEDDGGEGVMKGDGEVEEVPPVQQRRKGVRIVLKAKEYEPLKLTTREETNVETLIEAFRTQRDIGPEWEVAIWFDGERLDEESLVTDIDIDPEEANQLEVLVKKAAA